MRSVRTGAETIEVLLVEDSPGDVRLMREAFKDAKVYLNLRVASDGAEAMAFLNREGEHVNAPRPDLILLDLNLPKKDGREVLQEIKESPTLKSIPVVILTTSESDADILRSYRLHANCYITKPVGLEGFLEVVKSIDTFWLCVVKLPHQIAHESEGSPNPSVGGQAGQCLLDARDVQETEAHSFESTPPLAPGRSKENTT
jgi:chemotaxis family two-component system response regulator Rcp1